LVLSIGVSPLVSIHRCNPVMLNHAPVLASVALQQPIAFTEKSTFINDIASNCNSAMLPLKRAHKAPAPSKTTDSKDTDGNVGDHLREKKNGQFMAQPVLLDGTIHKIADS